MNQEEAIKEFYKCLAKVKAIQAELEETVQRWKKQLQFIQDGLYEIQTELDKLREGMNW